MDFARRGGIRQATVAITAVLSLLFLSRRANAQFPLTSVFELSDSVYVDVANSAAQRHVDRARRYREAEQWDEVVQTLRTVIGQYGDKMIDVAPRRYINLRSYCHLEISRLPPVALALYRQRVDPQAEAVFSRALAVRDEAALRQLVEETFCSSWSDDALWALGEFALERGDYAQARADWHRVIPNSAVADPPANRLACPDSDIPLAEIRARLILVSILEGDAERAASELAAYRNLHPEARGVMAGREVAFHDALETLLKRSQEWDRAKEIAQWATFAGSGQRTGHLLRPIDIGSLEWRVSMDPVAADASLSRTFGYRPRRVAEDAHRLLSHHPIVFEGVVYWCNEKEIHAVDLRTGKPVWGQSDSVIFREDDGRRRRPRSKKVLGVPRFTLSLHDGRLYARMGSPITCHANGFNVQTEPSYLVCLDLRAQGRLVWKIEPEDDRWAFEGAPLVEGMHLYVGMRRSDVRPQAHVACFDAESGRSVWRRLVCSAETPARGQVDESTSNLLTLNRNTLYYNTNLGAVAALERDSGQVNWIHLYRRLERGDLNRPAAYFYRDLNPCIYYRGKLLVAPADSEMVFAIEAATGKVIWETPHLSGVVHLLGAHENRLVASGDSLWWVDVDTGKVIYRWPDGPSPKGYGRGMLVGDLVYWPTRQEIHVFDLRSGIRERVIPLASQHGNVTGGNLVFADRHLLVAEGDELVAYGEYSRRRSSGESEITFDLDGASVGRDSKIAIRPLHDRTLRWIAMRENDQRVATVSVRGKDSNP